MYYCKNPECCDKVEIVHLIMGKDGRETKQKIESVPCCIDYRQALKNAAKKTKTKTKTLRNQTEEY